MTKLLIITITILGAIFGLSLLPEPTIESTILEYEVDSINQDGEYIYHYIQDTDVLFIKVKSSEPCPAYSTRVEYPFIHCIAS